MPRIGNVGLVQVVAVVAHAAVVGGHMRRSAGKDQRIHLSDLVERRGVRQDLRLDLEVLQDPPFPVGPLTPIVNDVNLHREMEWARH